MNHTWILSCWNHELWERFNNLDICRGKKVFLWGHTPGTSIFSALGHMQWRFTEKETVLISSSLILVPFPTPSNVTFRNRRGHVSETYAGDDAPSVSVSLPPSLLVITNSNSSVFLLFRSLILARCCRMLSLSTWSWRRETTSACTWLMTPQMPRSVWCFESPGVCVCV